MFAKKKGAVKSLINFSSKKIARECCNYYQCCFIMGYSNGTNVVQSYMILQCQKHFKCAMQHGLFIVQN